jgi:acetyltransferase-like isoleucine patch superfamily enzyme
MLMAEAAQSLQIRRSDRPHPRAAQHRLRPFIDLVPRSALGSTRTPSRCSNCTICQNRSTTSSTCETHRFIYSEQRHNGQTMSSPQGIHEITSIQSDIKAKAYDRALEKIHSEIEINPDNIEPYLLLKRIQLRSGSIDPIPRSKLAIIDIVMNNLNRQDVFDLYRKHLGLEFGAGVIVEDLVKFEGFNSAVYSHFQGPLEIGLKSYVAYYSFIGCRCKIGRYVSVGMNATIGPGNHPINWLTSHNIGLLRSPFPEPVDEAARFQQIKSLETTLSVGHDVWIGANAFIKSGIIIGDGAVIAAGAVVVKDVPPYAIVGGNPARVIRMRFPDDIIERLLASKWWTLPLDYVERLPLPRIQACLAQIADVRSRLSAECFI